MPRRNSAAVQPRTRDRSRLKRGTQITMLHSTGKWIPVTVISAGPRHIDAKDEHGVRYLIPRTAY